MPLRWKCCRRFVRKTGQRRPFVFLLSVTGLCSLFYLYIQMKNYPNPFLSLEPFLPRLTNSSRRSIPKEDKDEDFTHLRDINFYSEDGISSAYSKHHVGFPDMKHVNCPMALSTPTHNNQYPQTVNRIRVPQILKDAQNCSYFVNKYGFNRYPRPSAEEEGFPIAFAILFHKDLDQFLFLLRAIYRPHNAYCLSIDTKASTRFHYATRAVARCLPNVFVSSKLEDVVYAGMSRLMADINCFRDLVQHPVKWQYIINTPGQQFPLKTNLEIVQILKLFDGTNDILGRTGPRVEAERHRYVFKEVYNATTGEDDVQITQKLHDPPPFGMRVVKCSAYGAFSRAFIQFVLTNKLAKDLLEWSKSIYSPDERYWGMLNYNHVQPAPGGYLGIPDENPWFSSYTDWEQKKSSKCRSLYVRLICIFSPADLPFMTSVHYLFANKLKITYQPAALHCLDQRIFNNTLAGTTINTATYLGILKNRLAPRNRTMIEKIFGRT